MKALSRTVLVVIVAGAIMYVWMYVGYVVAQSQEATEEVIQQLPAAPALKPEEVELGKRLFFDSKLSGDATISCVSCHNPKKVWTDGIALSAGYPTSLYFRNTPTLLNTVYKKLLYWDGRLPGDDLPTVVRDHLSEAHFMQADGRVIEERLRQVPEYEEMFKAVYGAEPSYGKVLNAVSAYVKSLVSNDVPLDQYLAGQPEALSPIAERGLSLFQGKARCIQCHHGPMLTDERFHNLGLQENSEVFKEPLRHITFRRFFKTLGVEGYQFLREDVGLYAVTKDPTDKGKFKTPSLREVARTPPYMHHGGIQTLEEVVELYNQGGGEAPNKDPLLRPLGLSEQEKQDIVEFLKTLSGKETAVEPSPVAEYQLRELGKN